MKNILVIADGIVAKFFLQRVFELKGVNLHFVIITYNQNTLPKKPKSGNFTFLNFDPTSNEKLKNALLRLGLDFSHCMIDMRRKIDMVGAYNNIRSISPRMEIYIIDFWGFEYGKDEHLTLIDPRKILASRFIDYLPEIPVVADNIGFGEGEIMSVRVPAGSSFAYRRINSIQQKGWKICMIYRGQSYFVTNHASIILPNDTLLIAGNPKLLQQVFKSIKQNLGQFPAPFGSNILVCIDMKNMTKFEIDALLKDSLYLHSNLINKRLYIKVINILPSEILERLKLICDEKIFVKFDYFSTNLRDIRSEIYDFDIGLIVTNAKFFEKYKKSYFRLKIPVLKIGGSGFENLKIGVIFGNSENIEPNSSVILDICTQLNLEIELHYFEPQISQIDANIAEHFRTLSKIFNKNVNIVNDNMQNPISKFANERDLLQFVSFSQKIVKSNFLAIFSKDLDKLYYKFKQNYQLFIPFGL